MKKMLLLLLMMLSLFVLTVIVSQGIAAEFHVTNAIEFQDALNTATTNGQDDTIYLAAGTYQGNFTYTPPKPWPKSIAIMGEPGIRAEDIIIDGEDSGTALYFYDWTETEVAEVRIDGVTIQNGNSLGNGGGIFAAVATYNIFITNCILKNNTARGSGGGVYLTTEVPGGGTITLENNLILGNTVTEIFGGSRGAGASMAYTYGHCVIRNNIIARNTAQGETDPQGGGLWVGSGLDNIVHLVGNTIYANQATAGGGVYFEGVDMTNIYNNIIYGNTAIQGGDIYFGSVASRIGYNNDYSKMFGTWTDSGSNLDTDPLFLDPANNDFHLRPTSPMIGAGTGDVPNPPGLPATDFEGNQRAVGAAPDIGAYESPPMNPSEGTYGTEIAVSGSGFGTKKGKVLIGSTALKILEWANGLIRCQLTRVLDPGTYTVTIAPKGASSIIIENGFTVKTPEIDLINPTSGPAGDEITIYGFFFGTKKGKVFLGGKSCKIRSWTMDPTTGASEIRFVVPKGLSSGSQELKVINKVGEDTENFGAD